MPILFKQGLVQNQVKDPIRKLFKRLEDAFECVIVSSTNESAAGRRADSFHYVDLAIDIWGVCIKKGIMRHIGFEELIEVCGPGFDVIEYDGFYHIEYDPK